MSLSFSVCLFFVFLASLHTSLQKSHSFATNMSMLYLAKVHPFPSFPPPIISMPYITSHN